MNLNALFGFNTEDLINRDKSTEYKFEDSFASLKEYEQYLEKWAEFNRQEDYNAGMSAIAAQQIWVSN